MDTAIKEKAEHLIMLTSEFSDRHMDAEYKNLCEKLIMKMARKRNVPFLYGRPEIWAAAVIHAIGNINFLFDKSFKPYVSADVIYDYFGASSSAVRSKSKTIRDMFKMWHWSPEFSTGRMKEKNPFASMVSINGMIVDTRMLPPELQEIIRMKREQDKK